MTQAPEHLQIPDGVREALIEMTAHEAEMARRAERGQKGGVKEHARQRELLRALESDLRAQHPSWPSRRIRRAAERCLAGHRRRG